MFPTFTTLKWRPFFQPLATPLVRTQYDYVKACCTSLIMIPLKFRNKVLRRLVKSSQEYLGHITILLELVKIMAGLLKTH